MAGPKRGSKTCGVALSRARKSSLPAVPRQVTTSAKEGKESKLSSAWKTCAEPKAKARGARVCSVQVLTDKAIADNCGDMDEEELDCILVDTMSLRERVYRDKSLKEENKDSVSFGKFYWAELRRMYRSPKRETPELVKEPGHTVSEAFRRALRACVSQPPNRSHMKQHLRTTTSLTQNELVGVLNLFLELQPTASPDQQETLEAMMACFTRLGMTCENTKELRACRARLDTVATQVYVSTAAAIGPERWLMDNRPIWSLLLPVPEVEAILGMRDNEDFKDYATELEECIQSSNLGCRLFGWACTEVTVSKVQKQVEENINALLCMDKIIGSADLAAAQNKCVAECETLPGFALLPDRRETAVAYRGWPVPTKVLCVREEIELHFVSAVRGHAVAQKWLDPLPCEAQLCAASPADHRAKIHDDLLRKAKTARNHAATLLKLEVMNGDNVLDVLQRNRASLLRLDRHFFLDLSFLETLTGTEGKTRLEAEFKRRCLNKPGEHLTLKQAVEAATNLQNTDLYKFVTKAAQHSIDAAIGLLNQCLIGQVPKLAASSTEFLMDVHGKLPLFVWKTITVKEEVKEKTGTQTKVSREVFGEQAVKAAWKAIESKPAKDLSLTVIDEVYVYSFCLIQRLQDAIKEKRDEVKSANKSITPAATPVHPKAANKKRRKKSNADAESVADAKLRRLLGDD